MTDLIPPENDPGADRENLRRLAAAHTAASRELEALVRRLPATPDASDIAEYAALLAREETLRAERAGAATAAGLQLPSLGGG